MDFNKQDDDEADDIFASLGGSLMQELLADLNDDDGETGWLSLEQLEQELAHLDVSNNNNNLIAPAPLSAAFPTTAASLVVSAQQQMLAGGGPPGLFGGGGGAPPNTTTTVAAPGEVPVVVDAWSLSLQKFTEASLEADFLQADSVRKQSKTTTTTSGNLFATSMDLLSNAEEYNLTEPIRLSENVAAAVGPPPGLVSTATASSMMNKNQQDDNIAQQVANRLEHEQLLHQNDNYDDDDNYNDDMPPLRRPNIPKPAPPTPQNSMGTPTIFPSTPQNSLASVMMSPMMSNISRPPPPTPQNSVTIINNQVYVGDSSRHAVESGLLALEEDEIISPLAVTAATTAGSPTDNNKAVLAVRGLVPPTPANSMHNTPQQQQVQTVTPGGGAGAGASAWQQQPPLVATPAMPFMSPSVPRVAGGGPPPPPMQHQQQPQPPQAWGQPPPPVMAAPPSPHMMIPPGHVHPHPQQQQQQQQPRRRLVYANPHPNAPPIPAAALSSKYMSTRDISYVIHAILKPILLAEQQRGRETDYDQAYWRRHIQEPAVPGTGGGTTLGPYQKKSVRGGGSGRKDMHEKEMESRHQKAKEWSSEHAVLGQTAKTNVTRPRALIAQPLVGKGGDGDDDGTGAGTSLSNDQRQRLQRQALWKARIYCDQAYQAYSRVVEIWRTTPSSSSSSGRVPVGLQPHLVKLLKCLGITSTTTSKITTGPDGISSTKREKEYHSDEAVLALQMKLPKGRVLLARVLEQALLPPAAVQVLLPTALKVSYESKTTPTGQDDEHQQQYHHQHDPVDDRLFAAWARVVQSLPDLSGSSILQAMYVVQTNAKDALRTTCRMQMVHALLQRGGRLAAVAGDAVPATTPEAGQQQEQDRVEDSISSFAPRWRTVESDFMKFLEGGGVSA